MSRMRIMAKVRRNHCYQQQVQLLDELGLPYELHPPTGKGHPFLLIQAPTGGTIRHSIATTPKRRNTGDEAARLLRARLEQHGIDTKLFDK